MMTVPCKTLKTVLILKIFANTAFENAYGIAEIELMIKLSATEYYYAL